MAIKKTDKNHIEISNAFRQLYYSVLDLHEVGGGCPDLLVARYNKNFLVEIKNRDGFNKVGEKQKEFAEKWNTKVYVVRTIEDVIKLDEILSKIK